MSSDRNSQIAILYKGGKTLQEIGDMYGLSRERVRQLLKQCGITGKDGGAIAKLKKKRCLVNGCEVTDGFSQGYCIPHYAKFMRYGDPLYVTRFVHPDKCTVEGCERPYKANGYCNAHRKRFQTKGSTGSAEILPVGKHKDRGKRRDSKLSDSQKAEIRRTYKREPAVSGKPNEFSHYSLSVKYGVSTDTIRNVLKGGSNGS